MDDPKTPHEQQQEMESRFGFGSRSCRSRRYRHCEDADRRLTAQIFALLALASGLFYLVWIYTTMNWQHLIVSRFFYLAELTCYGLFVLATLGLWTLRFKPPEGMAPEEPHSVDVFIPTYKEPLHIVRKTVMAAKRIEWPYELNIWMLDDGGSDEFEAMAKELGIHYLSRPKSGVPNENAKAGNLNFGLKNTKGEYILTLDADQVPHPEILKVLAGYMRFPKTAFVQSKQAYLTQKGDPFYNRSQVFYDVVQLGLDNSDTAMSAGTGVIYNRKALEDIGGYAEWNIVEDLTTSYELHAHGWKSFYFPHALSKGLSPTTIWGVYQQRGQWALDTMRIFLWDNPLFKKGLPWRSKIGYMTVAFSYICSAFIWPFFFLIPIWTYLTGQTALNASEFDFVGIRAIYFLCMASSIHYLCYGQSAGKQFRMLAGLFPIYMSGIIRAFFYPRGKKPGYCVNNSTMVCMAKVKQMPQFVAVLPQTVILVLNLVLPFYAIAYDTAPLRLIAANVFISALAIWSMSQVVFGCLFPGRKWEDGENPEVVYAPDA